MVNSEIVSRQRDIAVKVLEKLSLVDPNAVLAGGAVRDWRFKLPATDLDFYLRTPNHYSIPLQEGLLAQVGFISVSEVSASDPKYRCMNNIERVYEASFDGQKCNIMVMTPRSWNWWYDFSNSLSECFMGVNGVACYTAAFEKSLLDKKVLVKVGYPHDHPHIMKIRNKFPSFTFEMKNKEEIEWLM